MWRVGPNSESAFTLLEVLVVMTILSLVGTAAALGLPTARDRIRFAQASAWLDSMLTSLRGQARRESRMTWVEFDPDAGRYRLSYAEWRALPPGVTWVVMSGQPPAIATPTVSFLPDGTGSGAAIAIRAGGYFSVHQVEWLTGSIRHVHH